MASFRRKRPLFNSEAGNPFDFASSLEDQDGFPLARE